MRAAPLPLILVACAATRGADEPLVLPDLAAAMNEPLHGFALGAPALRLPDDRLEGAVHPVRRDGPTVLSIDVGGRFTSGWMRWEEDFDELLVSWNARVPAGAGLAVEVQVASADGAGSPWLYLGDWGVGLPPAERCVSFAGGKVAVDVLQLEAPCDRARLRLSARGAGSAPVEVLRTALCLTDRTRLADLDPGAPTGPVAVPVPARTQRAEEAALAPRICSPTSVAMVLAAHGVERPTADVAALIYDADHDLYGNWPRAVQASFSLGVPGSLVRLSHWHAVEHFLRAGVPLIISVKAEPGELRGAPYPRTSGHLLVVRGLDAAGDVLVNDPAADSLDEVPRTYRREDLERCWLRRGGVAYAIGQ